MEGRQENVLTLGTWFARMVLVRAGCQSAPPVSIHYILGSLLLCVYVCLSVSVCVYLCVCVLAGGLAHSPFPSHFLIQNWS